MVLHVLSDDKFTDYVINQFKGEDMQSEMVVIPFGAGHSFTKCDKVSVVKYPSQDFIELLNRLHIYSAVVLHGMFWKFCEDIITAAPSNLKIAWYFWGAELYAKEDMSRVLLAPITKLLYRLHFIKKGQTYQQSLPWQLPLELYKRIDYCLTGEYEEYIFAKDYTHSNMDFLWYTCYSIEDTIGSLISYRSNGNKVLFCNSAAIENNMFDAALRLSRRKYRKLLGERHVIMPMGYGSPWVKNLMLRLGPHCFKNFKPIMDFLPRDQYNKMMIDCSTLILPYHSPAGQGNIITALWLGMRVYISEKSIAYKFFKRIGLVIFSFESDFEHYGCETLSDEVVDYNRNILLNIYSRERVYKSAKHVVDVLEK